MVQSHIKDWHFPIELLTQISTVCGIQLTHYPVILYITHTSTLYYMINTFPGLIYAFKSIWNDKLILLFIFLPAWLNLKLKVCHSESISEFLTIVIKETMVLLFKNVHNKKKVFKIRFLDVGIFWWNNTQVLIHQKIFLSRKSEMAFLMYVLFPCIL